MTERANMGSGGNASEIDQMIFGDEEDVESEEEFL